MNTKYEEMNTKQSSNYEKMNTIDESSIAKLVFSYIFVIS